MEAIIHNPNSFLSHLIAVLREVESRQPIKNDGVDRCALMENYEQLFYGSTYLRVILGKFIGTFVQRVVGTKTEFRFILYDESQEQQELQESFDYFEGEEDQKLDIENYITKISFLVPLSAEAITLALYYLDFVRFEVGLEVTKVNVHKLFVAAFLLASKFSYDKVYSNRYYSRVFGFSLGEVNTLEINFIRLIKFNITPNYDVWNMYFNAVLGVVARNIPNSSLIFSSPNSSLTSSVEPPSPPQTTVPLATPQHLSSSSSSLSSMPSQQQVQPLLVSSKRSNIFTQDPVIPSSSVASSSSSSSSNTFCPDINSNMSKMSSVSVQQQQQEGQYNVQRQEVVKEMDILPSVSIPRSRVRERRASESTIKLPFESIHPKEDSRSIKPFSLNKQRQPAPFPIIISNNNINNVNTGSGNNNSLTPRTGSVVVKSNESRRTRPGREKSSSFSSVVPIFTLNSTSQIKSPASASPRDSDISSSAGSSSSSSSAVAATATGRRPYTRLVVKTPQNAFIGGANHPGSGYSSCSESSLEGSLSELSPVKRMAFINSPDRIFPAGLQTPQPTTTSSPSKALGRHSALSPRMMKTRSKSREQSGGSNGGGDGNKHNHHHHHHHHNYQYKGQQLTQHKRKGSHKRSCSNNDIKDISGAISGGSQQKRLEVPSNIIEKINERYGEGRNERDIDDDIDIIVADQNGVCGEMEDEVEDNEDNEMGVDVESARAMKKKRAFSFSNDVYHSDMKSGESSPDATMALASVLTHSTAQPSFVPPYQNQLSLLPQQQQHLQQGVSSVPVLTHSYGGLLNGGLPQTVSTTMPSANLPITNKPTFKIVIQDQFDDDDYCDSDDDDDDDDMEVDDDDDDESGGLRSSEKDRFYGSFSFNSHK